MIQKNKKGFEIMAQYVTITSDKRKTPALLLCILGFFGIAGLHRFYVGKICTGLLWLCTGGFFLIGTLVDLFHILLGKFRDNTGVPLRQ